MIDWQTFLSVLAALITFRVLQGVPEFIEGFVNGWRDARKERKARAVLAKCSKNDRYPFKDVPCNYPGDAK